MNAPTPDARTTKSEPIRDITDTNDLARTAREFVARCPVENVPEKLLLHMAAEIEGLRRDLRASNRAKNRFRRRLSLHERGLA